MTQPARVVLVDEAGTPIGVADKTTVHDSNTPLHLAFSCYIVDASGRVLLTRRALSKATWPGVWTNSMCGHPGPGEATDDAVVRRGSEELGLGADAFDDLTLVLPDYRYRAVDASGIVEYEICPVYVARLREGTTVAPHAGEVAEWAWVAPRELVAGVRALPATVSPWMADQLRHEELVTALVTSQGGGV